MKDIKVVNMENEIIESMLDTALSNIVVRRVKEGTLILKNDSVDVLDNNNNNHFLTYCPYNFKGQELNKVTRKKINKTFIDKYKYEDIINIFEGIQEEKRNKAIKAEETKYILENLVNDISILKKYGDIEILANNNTIEYYIKFKRNHNINLEIYLSDEEELFNVRYNYKNLVLNREKLMTLVEYIIDLSEDEIREEQKEKQKDEQERNIYNKRLNFANEIQSGKKAIVKLKSGYQCIENNRRYSVGDGKSGKYYKLIGVSAIVEYLEKKDINKYVFIDESSTYRLTNEKLKSLNYINIV